MVQPQEILELYRKQPFEPFRIYMTDGAVHEVQTPRMVRIGTDCVMYFEPMPNMHPAAFKDYHRLSLLDIDRLERIAPNMKKKRKAR